MKAVYNNIKKKRYEMGLSQSELAEKVGYAEKSMIARIEAGKIDLPLPKVYKFAEVFDCSVYELMSEQPDKMKDFLNTEISVSTNSKEGKLEKIISTLNDNGIDKLLEYALDLAEMPKYRKE